MIRPTVRKLKQTSRPLLLAEKMFSKDHMFRIKFMGIFGHSLAARLKQLSSRNWSTFASVISVIISVTSSSGRVPGCHRQQRLTVYDTLIDSSVSAVRAEVVQDNISRHCPRCFSPDTSGFGCPGDDDDDDDNE